MIVGIDHSLRIDEDVTSQCNRPSSIPVEPDGLLLEELFEGAISLIGDTTVIEVADVFHCRFVESPRLCQLRSCKLAKFLGSITSFSFSTSPHVVGHSTEMFVDRRHLVVRIPGQVDVFPHRHLGTSGYVFPGIIHELVVLGPSFFVIVEGLADIPSQGDVPLGILIGDLLQRLVVLALSECLGIVETNGPHCSQCGLGLFCIQIASVDVRGRVDRLDLFRCGCLDQLCRFLNTLGSVQQIQLTFEIAEHGFLFRSFFQVVGQLVGFVVVCSSDSLIGFSNGHSKSQLICDRDIFIVDDLSQCADDRSPIETTIGVDLGLEFRHHF